MVSSKLFALSFITLGVNACIGGETITPVTDAKVIFDETHAMEAAAEQAEDRVTLSKTLGSTTIKWLENSWEGSSLVDKCITTITIDETTYYTGRARDCSSIDSRLKSLQKDLDKQKARAEKREQKRADGTSEKVEVLTPKQAKEYVKALRRTPSFDYNACLADAEDQFGPIINARLEGKCAAGSIELALEKTKDKLSEEHYPAAEKLIRSMTPEEQNTWAQIHTGASEYCLRLHLANTPEKVRFRTREVALDICFDD